MVRGARYSASRTVGSSASQTSRSTQPSRSSSSAQTRRRGSVLTGFGRRASIGGSGGGEIPERTKGGGGGGSLSRIQAATGQRVSAAPNEGMPMGGGRRSSHFAAFAQTVRYWIQ